MSDPNLEAALEGTQLFISNGDGESGPLDATIDAYGAGTHSDPYLKREFDRALPILSAALHESGDGQAQPLG